MTETREPVSPIEDVSDDNPEDTPTVPEAVQLTGPVDAGFFKAGYLNYSGSGLFKFNGSIGFNRKTCAVDINPGQEPSVESIITISDIGVSGAVQQVGNQSENPIAEERCLFISKEPPSPLNREPLAKS